MQANSWDTIFFHPMSKRINGKWQIQLWWCWCCVVQCHNTMVVEKSHCIDSHQAIPWYSQLFPESLKHHSFQGACCKSDVCQDQLCFAHTLSITFSKISGLRACFGGGFNTLQGTKRVQRSCCFFQEWCPWTLTTHSSAKQHFTKKSKWWSWTHQFFIHVSD